MKRIGRGKGVLSVVVDNDVERVGPERVYLPVVPFGEEGMLCIIADGIDHCAINRETWGLLHRAVERTGAMAQVYLHRIVPIAAASTGAAKGEMHQHLAELLPSGRKHAPIVIGTIPRDVAGIVGCYAHRVAIRSDRVEG